LENLIDGDAWLNYFTSLSQLPDKFKDRVRAIETKIQELKNSQDFNSFYKLDFKISLPEIQKSNNFSRIR
jgi:hypothetical protein